MPQSLNIKAGENNLALTYYEPADPNGDTILVNSALGTRQEFYSKIASWLAAQGFRTYTWDYSGIGGSFEGSVKHVKSSTTHWGMVDMKAVIDFVYAESNPKHLILLNHSVGGQLIAFCPSASKADIVLNIACSSGSFSLWKGWRKIAAWLNFALLKTFTMIFGYFPGKALNVMENLPSGVGKEWSSWGMSANYLFDHVPNAFDTAAQLSMPLISYSFSQDTSSPRQSVEWLNSQYKNAELLHRHICSSDYNTGKLGHFDFFRSKNEVLWQLLKSDLDAALSNLNK